VRPELKRVLEELLAASAASGEVHLDAVGEAIGARAITTPEIEALLDGLSAAGRTLVSPPGGDGEAHLKAVIAAARALGPALGRRPTAAEIAERAGLPLGAVLHALALVKIMQR
jgi:hypothetical protein